jgi:hypothetical protein
MDKCYKGMVNIPPQISDPCDGNPTSTNCVQSPIANPYLSLPAGATQTEINAALSSALIYKDSQIATINNQPALQLKTVGGESLIGTGNIPFPSGGGGGVIEITYAELVSLIGSSMLVVGQVYLLTDYMTTYTQPVTNATMSSGVVEQLFLTAVDVNKLHKIAKSKLYPQDIIYYEVTGDIDNGFGTEGFTKGKIYRRIDTLRNNDIGTDWRYVTYSITGTDRTFFLPNGGYNGCYNNKIETYNLFNSVVGANFKDNTLSNIDNNNIGDYFFGNSINALVSNVIADYFQYNNITFFSGNTTLGAVLNNVGRNCANNTIGDSFNDNNIGDYFFGNSIGVNFIGNNIKDNFSNNTVLNFFRKNSIERDFTGKTVGGIMNNRLEVSDLPTSLTCNQKFIVTDALTPSYLSTVVGGGTTVTPVIWNGSNWVCN